VLRPARSDATTDYCEVTEKLGEAEILPGHTRKIWGYCVTFPWPMLETHSRGSAGQAISLRQAAVTAGILGRTNASYRFTVTGIAAIGALIGGALGGLIGLRATMIVGALGTLAAMCFVIRSPIAKLLDLSELEPDGASAKTGPATCDEAAAPDDIALSRSVLDRSVRITFTPGRHDEAPARIKRRGPGVTAGASPCLRPGRTGRPAPR